MDGVTETLARRYALETIIARDSGLVEYHPVKGRMKGRLQLPRVREAEIHSLLPQMKILAKEVTICLFKEMQELVGASGASYQFRLMAWADLLRRNDSRNVNFGLIRFTISKFWTSSKRHTWRRLPWHESYLLGVGPDDS